MVREELYETTVAFPLRVVYKVVTSTKNSRLALADWEIRLDDADDNEQHE